jgi:hypothetical protein
LRSRFLSVGGNARRAMGPAAGVPGTCYVRTLRRKQTGKNSDTLHVSRSFAKT